MIKIYLKTRRKAFSSVNKLSVQNSEVFMDG